MKDVSNKTVPMTDALYEYVLRSWSRESDLMKRLRQETAAMPEAGMQISPDQGQLMHVLAKLLGVRRYLEIGVFTGYSSLSVATALPHDGEVVACDVSEEFTAIARRYWQEAGVSDKIDLRIAPAQETLAQLPSGSFDLAFIDADKPGYPAYFEECLRLVRKGGAILVDNVLWDGKVADDAVADESTVILREFNAKLHRDERVDLALIPIADGLSIARVR